MTSHENRADAPDLRRVRVEQTLARYPAISDAEIADLLHWFRKEASAMDVAMLASDERIAGCYALFRADHLDRLGVGEKIAAWILAAMVIAAIAGYALL
jgi:hypothetical protein